MVHLLKFSIILRRQSAIVIIIMERKSTAGKMSLVSAKRKATGDAAKSGEIEKANLLDLPNEILLKILTYLSYNRTANLRPVCKRFNNLCSYILNKGYQSMIADNLNYFETTDDPDAYSFMYAWIMKTFMTCFEKTIGLFVEQKDCVFFPGKILDLASRISRNIRKSRSHLSTHNKMKQFRTLFNRAIEHFDTFVKPRHLNLRRNANRKYNSQKLIYDEFNYFMH